MACVNQDQIIKEVSDKQVECTEKHENYEKHEKLWTETQQDLEMEDLDETDGENEHESSQNSEHYLDDMSWEGAPVACLIAPTTLNTDVDLSQPGVADSFDSYCIFNSDDGDAGWEGAPVAYLIAVTEFDVDVDLSEPGAGDAFDSYTLV